MIPRRDFLKSMAAVTSSLMLPAGLTANSSTTRDKWGSLLPQRMLGKTGVPVTMLGVGGFHVGWTLEKDAQEVIEAAIEGGIRFFDTAESYQKGESERRYGKYLVPKYRDEVYIMTKTTSRTAEGAMEHLEGSLKRMNCDYVDLWQIHSVRDPNDVDNRLDQGVLKVLEKAQAQGKVKHIGFTGHANPYAHKWMLEMTKGEDPMQTIQMPINCIDPHFYSFMENALPESVKRNYGIIAMKTLADGRFFAEKKRLDQVQWTSDDPLVPNHITIKEALDFAWSMPVSTLVTGAENADMLKEKIEYAKAFVEMTETDRAALLDRTEALAGNAVEYYKRV